MGRELRRKQAKKQGKEINNEDETKNMSDDQKTLYGYKEFAERYENSFTYLLLSVPKKLASPITNL